MAKKNDFTENNKAINYEPLLCPVLDFGDHGIIEMKRYGCKNEQYTHKVIGRLRSNTWVDVPVQSPATETMHDEMVDVIRCVCCGVSETEVLKYRISDVKPNGA